MLANQCPWWVPRSEKFRAAVDEDVNTRMNEMQTARDTLRSYMDDNKDIVLSGWTGWFELILAFQEKNSNIYNTYPSAFHSLLWSDTTALNISTFWSKTHVKLLVRVLIPWQADMVPDATEQLKRALSNFDNAMGPVKKMKPSKGR